MTLTSTRVRNRWFTIGLVATVLAACGGEGDAVHVTNATYRAPLGSGSVGVGYMTIESRATDQIVAVASPAARSVEIHSTVFNGATASMRPTPTLDLPANTPVKLAAGGVHLMVIEPQRIESGATFPVTLQLASGRTLNVELAVDQNPVGPS